ncbi:MAG: hypothetical protein JJU40_05430 [Rhodobacteraceae bacterium]|nr:hypothetical protein [Paracoccaceae bacterium]
MPSPSPPARRIEPVVWGALLLLIVLAVLLIRANLRRDDDDDSGGPGGPGGGRRKPVPLRVETRNPPPRSRPRNRAGHQERQQR